VAEQPAGPPGPLRPGPRGPRRSGLHLPRPRAARAADATALSGDALYRERRHPLWFFARSWLWLLLLAVTLPITLRAEGRAAQLVGGVLVLVSQLAILLRLIDWATTLVVVSRPATLQIVGYEGQHHTADLRTTAPRIVQGRLGRALGYAHLVTRRPGIRPKTSSQMFLTRPDELRRALDAALRASPGNR